MELKTGLLKSGLLRDIPRTLWKFFEKTLGSLTRVAVPLYAYRAVNPTLISVQVYF
jgi:hypothetical protein